ncbi:MAG TPA: hypothetical protein VGI10_15910 [Polyangiaceae bacterium]
MNKLSVSKYLAPLAAIWFVTPLYAQQPADKPAAPPVGTPPAAPPAAEFPAPAPPPVSPAAEPAPQPPPIAAPSPAPAWGPPPSAPAPIAPIAPPAVVSAELPAAATDETKAPSWFSRPPLAITIGEGAKKFALTFFGFVEADYIYDSTRSYGDAIGRSLVARDDTYEGRAGRSQFSMRNTRLGLAFDSPVVDGVKPAALIEGDFFGNGENSGSEAALYGSPTFRVRQAYLSLKNDYVDVLAGQSYDVFGWQNYFFPCSLEFLGLPNQLFSRSMQFRLSHSFVDLGPIKLELAAAAVRPAQRDSGTPDANAGLRVSLDGWKGITTPGNTGTLALPASIGVSGTVRRFKVNAFTPPPAQRSNNTNGWGVSIDALLPVIPAKDSDDRGNRLTLTGSFVTGAGIGDLIGADGGATFPTLPNPAQANPPPLYDADIDNGLVSFDTQGVLHAINWRAVRAGVQYYLPPTGRVIFAANYTESFSDNMSKLFPKGGAEVELLNRVGNRSRYGDVNLMWDATPAVRFGISGQYTWVRYLDNDRPHNLRGMAQALYAF